MAKTVPDALADLAAIYRERNAIYKDDYLTMGTVLIGLFPHGIHLETGEELARFALFLDCVGKLGRYARTIKTGGHADSLDDNSIYSQMLQQFDSLAHEARGSASVGKKGRASSPSSTGKALAKRRRPPRLSRRKK